jgi:hypothetical protein
MRRLLAMTTLLLLPRPALAQISPGDLAQGHATLEGSAHCLDCHDPGKGVASDRCLACHTPLKQRVAAGRGLHARPDYRQCATCHVEHQGRAAELVWWGKAGRQAFEHGDTGYALEGKHVQLACEQCHKAKRTYLGLATACVSCHADEHRGQFAKADCRACHGMDGWKPAAGFNHARSAFPLTGRHAPVACDKCHAVATDTAGRTFRRFRGVAFQQCTSCHSDTHNGRLGANCAACHTTAAWSNVQTTSFDHDKTRYPLRGRHTSVACEKCHSTGRRSSLRYANCSDCHQDAHRGDFASRADKGRCEACHVVAGFAAARFGPEDHQKTAYPLAGAHQAVACDACHKRAPDRKTAVYRVAHARCTDCHRDPHRGDTDKYSQKVGCEACHGQGSWRQVTFDHAGTRFALAGGHLRAACTACHKKTDAATPRERLRFTGLPIVCESCHKDSHAAQFAVAGATNCERCHGVVAWKADRFDHNRDAAYHLDGAHARVACERCHAREARDGRSVVRYKPLASACRDCHGAGRAS